MDIDKILYSIQSLRDEFGSDIDKFFNYKELYKVQPLMEKFRARREFELSKYYLPGWRFENLDQFIYMMKTGGFRFENFDQTQRPAFGDSWWIRSIFVPNKYHYLSELAHHLRQKYHNCQGHHPSFDGSLGCNGWPALLNLIISQKYLAGGIFRGRRSDQYYSVSLTTARRWANKAEIFRAERISADTPSYWKIISANLYQKELNLPERSKTAIDLLDTGYMETWEWVETSNLDSPARKNVSFDLPCGPNTWHRPWKRHSPSISSE